MANGQCFVPSSVLAQVAIPVLGVLCDDVTLARNIAALGSRWAFRWREGAEGTNV